MLQKNWITVKEAAELIGCTVQHVRSLIKKHKWEYNKVTERLIVVHVSTIEKYCKVQQTVGRPRISKKSSTPVDK